VTRAEDWATCGRCPTSSGHKLPLTACRIARGVFQGASSILPHRSDHRRDSGVWAAGGARRDGRTRRPSLAVEDSNLTNPIARARPHGRCSVIAQGSAARTAAGVNMAELCEHIWPLIVMVAQTSSAPDPLIALCLRAFGRTANHGRGADAARAQRVGPFGSAAVFAISQFVLKSRPSRRRHKACFLLAPGSSPRAGALRLGGDPVNVNWAIPDITAGCCNFSRSSSRMVPTASSWRVGLETRNTLPGGAAFGGADGVLTCIDRLSSFITVSLVRRLAHLR